MHSFIHSFLSFFFYSAFVCNSCCESLTLSPISIKNNCTLTNQNVFNSVVLHRKRSTDISQRERARKVIIFFFIVSSSDMFASNTYARVLHYRCYILYVDFVTRFWRENKIWNTNRKWGLDLIAFSSDFTHPNIAPARRKIRLIRGIWLWGLSPGWGFWSFKMSWILGETRNIGTFDN